MEISPHPAAVLRQRPGKLLYRLLHGAGPAYGRRRRQTRRAERRHTVHGPAQLLQPAAFPGNSADHRHTQFL